MTMSIRSLTAATLVALCAATTGSASSLQSPLAVAPGAMLLYSEFDPRPEIAVFGSVSQFDGVSGFTSADLTLFFDYELAAPPSAAQGVFQIVSGSAFLLTGSILSATLEGPAIRLSLGDLGGPEAARLGTPLFADIDFDIFPGSDIFGALTNSAPFGVTVTFGTLSQMPPVSAIPLPAGLPLLISGLGLAAWISRRRT